MQYKPHVPVDRLVKILNEYMDRYQLNRRDLARELAAGTMLSQETWERRLFAWFNGETSSTHFGLVDSALCALDLTDRWHTDLADIYSQAA